MKTRESGRKGSYIKPNDLFVVEIIRFRFQMDFNLLSRTMNVNDKWNELLTNWLIILFWISHWDWNGSRVKLKVGLNSFYTPEVLGQYKHYLHFETC